MNKKLSLLILTNLCFGLSYGQWEDLNLNQGVSSIINVNGTEIAGTGAGIYYKVESTTTWNAATGMTGYVSDFTVENNILYASGYERLYTSTDNGGVWSSLPVIRTNTMINAVVANGSHIVAGTDGGGVYYSSNDGNSWGQATSTWSGRTTDIVKKDNVFFSSYHMNGKLQRSTDNTGQQWASPPASGLNYAGFPTSYQNIKALTVLNDTILIAGTNNGAGFESENGVYFSYDNGNTFTRKINGLDSTDITALATMGELLFAGTANGGVYYSSDEGDNWVSLNSGLTDLSILKLYGSGSSLYACTPTDLFKLDVCDLLKETTRIAPTGLVVLESGESIVIKVNGGGNDYAWYQDEELILSADSSAYITNTAGDYQVIIHYSQSCSDTTDVLTVIADPLSIQKKEIENSFSIYPNPVENELFISGISNDFEFEIVDLQGKLKLQGKAIDRKIDMTTLKSGVYLMKVKSEGSESIQKFIKQ